MKIKLDLKLLKVMVLVILLVMSIFIFSSNGSNMKEVLNFTPVQELYKSITITLLMPNVNEAINNYYKKYLKVSPREDSYSIELLEAERILNNAYLVKFKAFPYIGAHNSVGLDYWEVIIYLLT